jgi:integrase
MPSGTEVERRDRALVAFALLTGERDSAIASLKLKHVDLIERCVLNDARDVHTKFGKTFTTYFFPVGEEVERIVADWVRFLREDNLWGNDDPLFPATKIALGTTRQFEAAGLERTHWSTATPIRTIFRDAFGKAGLPYFNPHSLRKTLTRMGGQLCQTAEEYKAWSQNLGHEQVLTTLMSYGKVAAERQGEIIRDLAVPRKATQSGTDELAEALARKLRDAGATLPAAD